MSNANLGHKLLFYVCAIVVIIIGFDVVSHIFASGLRIMLFGFRMVLVPIILAAAIYITWHVRKFFM
jgi:hypothetical protein